MGYSDSQKVGVKMMKFEHLEMVQKGLLEDLQGILVKRVVELLEILVEDVLEREVQLREWVLQRCFLEGLRRVEILC